MRLKCLLAHLMNDGKASNLSRLMTFCLAFWMDAKCFGISMWEHITHTAHKHVDYSWHAYVVIYAIQREKIEQKNLLHGYDSPTLSNIQ